MKVLVLGGDGFCGWPCAVNLADQGHDVLIVDNLSRRKIDIDLEVEEFLNAIADDIANSIREKEYNFPENLPSDIQEEPLDNIPINNISPTTLSNQRPAPNPHLNPQWMPSQKGQSGDP